MKFEALFDFGTDVSDIGDIDTGIGIKRGRSASEASTHSTDRFPGRHEILHALESTGYDARDSDDEWIQSQLSEPAQEPQSSKKSTGSQKPKVITMHTRKTLSNFKAHTTVTRTMHSAMKHVVKLDVLFMGPFSDKVPSQRGRRAFRLAFERYKSECPDIALELGEC